MRPLLRAEARRVLSLPATWWLLAGTVAVGVLGTLAPLLAFDASTADLVKDQQVRASLHGAAGGSLLVLVAGITGAAGEWRFGQVSQTFLTTPRRSRVVAAKALTYLVVGGIYGGAAALAATATAWQWYRSQGQQLPLGDSSVWLTLVGCLAVSVLFGALGVGFGAIVRNQVTALVASLTWLVLVEPALFAAAPTIFRWLPGIASLSLRRQPDADLLPVGAAATVLGIVTVVALVLGVRQVVRDDVAS